MAHVDLCSGIGGFALGFEWAELSKPVLFCDIEPWSRQILAKHWPDVPIADDVKELANDPTRIIHAIGDRPSILTAGYPCQPFSQAGQRRGSQDDRHIWPEIFSIVQQVRPDWLICENVSGHITMGLNEVLSDLADKAHYAVQTFHLGAVSVDAPHRRMRIWIVARNVGNSKHDGSPTPTVKGSIGKASKHNTQGQNKTSQSQGASEPRDSGSVGESARTTNVADAISARGETWASDTVGDGDGSRSNKKQPESSGSKADVANADSRLGETQHQRSVLGKQNPEGSARGHSDEGLQGNRQWKPEPAVGRVANGIPRRVDRLKGLGNAIVPQIAMRIGQTIKAVEETT
jgi:DNA (cytosine-5)-methyltransferase 1